MFKALVTLATLVGPLFTVNFHVPIQSWLCIKSLSTGSAFEWLSSSPLFRAMSNILKARKRKVLVEFLPATFFVWILCTRWLFGLSYKMPNFSKLESQLYEYLTMRAKKTFLIVSNKYSFPIISSSVNLSWLIFN